MWFGEPHLLPDWARRDNEVTKGDRVELSPPHDAKQRW